MTAPSDGLLESVRHGRLVGLKDRFQLAFANDPDP